MEVIDPGHYYQLNTYDGDEPEFLQFVKRVGDKYPGNTNAYSGTLMQEVLRALINRCQYVNNQHPAEETQQCIELFRQAIRLLEGRARRVRGQWPQFPDLPIREVEHIYTCPVCGHIRCLNHNGE